MDKWLEHNGVRMHYRVSGDGKQPLILMHGWGCNVDTVAMIEKTAAESCTVFNVDLPGHGQSTEPPGGWGIEEFTRMIERLAEKENITSPILVGHSFGGRVSILFSSRNDTRKVILVDAAGVKPRRKLSYYIKVYSFKLGKRWKMLTLGKEKALRAIEAERQKRGSADYRNATPVMRAVMSKCVNEDLKAVMPSIKAPTLLIWGENDTATPMRDARIMERLIPGAALVSFPGCGHFSFLDNPVQFTAVLRSFLTTKD